MSAEFEKLQAEYTLEGILLGEQDYFARGGKHIVIPGVAAEPSIRIEAAQAMGASHCIDNYPLLRKAAMTDPDADVRAAVKLAEAALEEEFGEEACLLKDEEFTGGLRPGGTSVAAAETGDYYGADLNDFR